MELAGNFAQNVISCSSRCMHALLWTLPCPQLSFLDQQESKSIFIRKETNAVQKSLTAMRDPARESLTPPFLGGLWKGTQQAKEHSCRSDRQRGRDAKGRALQRATLQRTDKILGRLAMSSKWGWIRIGKELGSNLDQKVMSCPSPSSLPFYIWIRDAMQVLQRRIASDVVQQNLGDNCVDND